MPDVGVLNLTIQDNSKSAADGLEKLAQKLERVKQASENFDISPVSKQISSIGNSVKSENKTVAALGTLFNAIANFAKLKSPKIDVTPITQLKDIFADGGIKIGNAGSQLNQLRTAIEGEWKTENAQQAGIALAAIGEGAKSLSGTNLGTVAKNVSAVAKALEEYATAGGKIKDVVSAKSFNGVENVRIKSNEIGENIVAGEAEGIRNNIGEAISATKELVDTTIGSTKEGLGIESPSKEFKIIGVYIVEGMIAGIISKKSEIETVMADLAKSLTGVTKASVESSGDWRGAMMGLSDSGKGKQKTTGALSSIKELTEALQGSGKLNDYAQGLSEIASAIDRGAKSYLTLGRLATSMEKVKTALQGFKVPDMSRLESLARALSDNFNAGTGLNRMAEGMEAIKAASQGFKMPSAKDMGKIISVMSNTDITNGQQAGTPVGSVSESINEAVQGMQQVDSTLQSVNDSMSGIAHSASEEIVGTVREAAEEAVPGLEKVEGELQSVDKTAQGVASSVEEATEAVQEYNEAIEFARKWNASKSEKEPDLPDIESAKMKLEAFSALVNANEKIADLTTKLGFAIKDYDKEMESKEPSERKLNALSLQIDSILKQIDDLNSKSFKLDFAKDITPESLGELSEIDRLIQKREDLTRTLYDDMEVNKLSVSQIMSRMEQIEKLTGKIEKLQAAEEEERTAMLSVSETNEMQKYVTQIDYLIEKLEEARVAYNNLANDPNASASKRMEAAMDVNKAVLEIQQYNELQGLLENVSPEIQRFAQEQLNAGVSAATLRNRLFDLDGELKQKKKDINDVSEETKTLGQRFSEAMLGTEGFHGALGRMFPTLSMLLKRFKSMTIMRGMRYIIRQISAGFREGVENVYHYSRIVGTDLAPAMDAAATSLQQMKNSIGAAVAPVIQALVPVLQNVVNWFINLINYANQFFALLNGQKTWTRALPEQAEAFNNTAKNAKKASKATKDLLADWDELNIISSQDGGSAGTIGGHTAEEYKNMFEEVDKYNDAVTSFSNIIKDTFSDALRTAKLIGAAILGWKVSRAFNGVLGSLGKIAAGIALEIIGIELSYNAGKDAGMNGWNAGNIISAIGGVLATALGGALITSGFGMGGGIGFAIGLTVGVIATLIGWIEGKNKAADAIKWGNLHMTADEVKEYVRKQFAFDVTAEITALHTNIADMEGAKKEANTKIAKFEETLNAAKVNVSLGVDADPEGTTVKDAVISAQDAVKAVETELTKTETAIAVGLKYLPHTNNGEDISDDYLAGIMVADQPIRDYMRLMGEELAQAMLDGEKAGWENGTDAAAIKLMQEQQEIYRKAQEYAKQYELERNIENATNGVVKDGVWDRETAEAAYQEQQRLLGEYAETAREEARAEIAQLEYLAGLAQAASERAFEKGQVERGSDLERSAQELKDLAQSRMDGIEADIELKVNETKKKIGEQWVELIGSVYGEDIGKLVKEKIANTEYGDGGYYFGYIIDSMFGAGHDTEYGKILKKGGSAEEIANGIAAYLRQVYMDLGNTGVVGYQPPSFINDIIDNFISNPLGMMDNSTKDKLRKSLIDYFGDKNFADEVYAHLFDINPDDLKEWIKLNELKNKYDVPIDADATVVLDEVKLEFDQERMDALKKQIDDALEDGLMTKNEKYLLDKYFGPDIVNQVLDELYNLDEEGYNRGAFPKGRMIASVGGVSDVGFGRVNYNPQPQTTTNNADVATDVATGTARGNETQNGLIQQLISLCQQIARKDFTVNISPSSDWGRFNAKSGRQYNAVTGEEQ